jgi:hypothetical protein
LSQISPIMSSANSTTFDAGEEDDDEDVFSADDEEEEDIYGPPTADEVPNSMSLSIAVDDNPTNHVDNYEILLDDVDDNHYTLSEKMVHYIGGHVVKQHWKACKAVLCFHAGAYVSKLPPMTKSNRDEAVLHAYNGALAELDTTHFCPASILFFRQSFRSKNDTASGLALWRYFQTTRHAIRNIVLPLFPTNFNTMKSGKGFHDTVTAAMTTEYRKSLVRQKDPASNMTMEEAEQHTAPMFWEYKTSPWFFALATKIFRRHVQVAPVVDDVINDPENAPVSRAKLKRQMEWKDHHVSKKSNKSKSMSCDVADVIDVDAEEELREKNKRKESTVASTVMNTNLNVRMGRMHELKESMDFLDRFKSIIGDKEYDARALKLLNALPDPETFCSEVSSQHAHVKKEKETAEDGS